MLPADLIVMLHQNAQVAPGSALAPLSGRHVLFAQSEVHGDMRVELRSDPDLGVLSGDVFQNVPANERVRNADWLFSFQSEALYSCGSDVAAICTLYRDQRYKEVLAPGAKVLVRMQPHAEHRHCVGLADVVVLNEAAEIRPIPTAFLARSADAFGAGGTPIHSDLVRQVHLNLYSDLGTSVSCYDLWRDEVLSAAIYGGDERGGLRSWMARAGVYLVIPKTPVVLKNTKPAASLAEISALFSPAQFSDDPWQTSILVSALVNPEKESLRRSMRVPYGRTFGLQTGVAKTRSRFGAAVFIDQIIRAYCKHKNLSDADLRTPFHTDVLIRRVRFTFLHELGHLLNLPHSWQRDQFSGSTMRANPSDTSALAYGSKYPMGILHDHALRHVAKNKDESALDTAVFDYSLRNMERSLADPEIPPLEQRHIRHAPFPTIGIGETSFIEDPTDQPRITRLWHAHKRLHLEIERARASTSDADGPGAQALTLRTHASGNRLNRIEPPNGFVTLKGPALSDLQDNGVTKDTAMFGFMGGALKVILREDPPDRRDPMAPARVFDMPAIPMSGALDHDIRPVRSNEGDGSELRVPIPFLRPQFLHDLTTTGRLTLQVVYVGPDLSELRSEPVHISIDYKTPLPALPACIKDILADPLLPLLCEAPQFLNAATAGTSTVFDFNLRATERANLNTLISRLTSQRVARRLGERDGDDLRWLANLAEHIRTMQPVSQGIADRTKIPAAPA